MAGRGPGEQTSNEAQRERGGQGSLGQSPCLHFLASERAAAIALGSQRQATGGPWTGNESTSSLGWCLVPLPEAK